MTRAQQEEIFIVEMQNKLSTLAQEFDLNTLFVIGALEMIVHGIKQDYYQEVEARDEDPEEEM